ncbi:uncharacterized protein BJ171DRAFT_294636 [Polychytrium aggregatum]|uniref:uncharacterized protein n=1 Tax=Polychytrium aggregatum TaxID=110093 RepID=UPI0022FEC988|nr:uncharacterized protein BJ171DRAFT_294636 [Polychytrium aggregatum]KAI9207279.1 hypothetical protein BJ171DRAFT_294636 [Polychytrium aggregatum]
MSVCFKSLSRPLVPVDEIHDFYSIHGLTVPADRPYSWSNNIQTLDGCLHFLEDVNDVSDIALKNVPGNIGDNALADWRLLNSGWAFSDAVLLSGQILRDEKEVACSLKFDDLVDLRLNRLGKKTPHPIQLVITGGNIDLGHSLFKQDVVRVVLLTTETGAATLESQRAQDPPVCHLTIKSFPHVGGKIDLTQVLRYLRIEMDIQFLDVSCGGSVSRQFVDLGVLDEVRMTIAGQVAGAFSSTGQLRPQLWPALSSGVSFNPSNSPLVAWRDIRVIGQHHLFFRGVYQYRHL